MHSIVRKFENYKYRGVSLDTFWVIFNERWKPPLVPLLFTTFLARFNAVFEIRTFSNSESRRSIIFELVEKEIGRETTRSYVYCLAQFLSYLEECHQAKNTPDMHSSTSCSERFVNHYLNEVLAHRLGAAGSLGTHCAALTAFFNFCHYMDFTERMNLRVARKTRQRVAEKGTKQHYIQYVPRDSRRALLTHCRTLAEKLVMRMGFEVGLRTSELKGLKAAKLQVLFNKLGDQESAHLDRFSYWLEGRYTKGGKSRWIYLDRELLSNMHRYYKSERQWIVDQTDSTDDTFFLRTDTSGIGKGISAEHGTNVFRKRAKTAGLNPRYSFHDLRHTFATELFHEELADPDGRETRSESAALIVVAQRLGHAFSRDGNAPAVTTRYVRMRLQMIELEGGF